MSRLIETRRAYKTIADLLDQQIRKGGTRAKELERFRNSLHVAFYLLGWGQFEHLVRMKIKEVVEEKSKGSVVDGHAWRFLSQNIKLFTVREQLAVVFHSSPDILKTLRKDYSVRNDAAHNYQLLPTEVRDMEGWLSELEGLVDRL